MTGMMTKHVPEMTASTGAPEPDAERLHQLEAALREKDAELREKDAELRELQHRAKNSLQMVISLLKLQVGRIRDPDARAAYEQTLLRIEALAILYRQLHETRSTTHVNVVPYLNELCQSTSDNLRGGAHGIDIQIVAEPVEVGLYEAMPLGLIVTELLTNSLRHAYPDKGWVKLTLNRTGEHQARIEVADNGRALPAGFDEDGDTGMMLVEALAAQLGEGLTSQSTSQGTTATFTFAV